MPGTARTPVSLSHNGDKGWILQKSHRIQCAVFLTRMADATKCPSCCQINEIDAASGKQLQGHPGFPFTAYFLPLFLGSNPILAIYPTQSKLKRP